MPPPRELDIQALIEGVRANDRARLAQAITLVESRAPRHADAAHALMQALLPHSGGALRLGLTGVPGAGKSTFIEALGMHLCGLGKKVAVLAVDPSSSVHGGSILGDKTRMETLCREPNAFIRPSPSGDSPGGVAARTREALLICEAAGYDVILVETVGVGQGETAVRTMTDCFLLLQITGAGDALQGIKKGIVELADLIVINKADGDNTTPAELARSEYERLLQILQPFTPGWKPRAATCSALHKHGIDAIWELVETFRAETQQSGVFHERRQVQNLDWFNTRLQQAVMEDFKQKHAQRLTETQTAVAQGTLPVAVALQQMLG